MMFITLFAMLFVTVWGAYEAIRYLLEEDDEPWVEPRWRDED